MGVRRFKRISIAALIAVVACGCSSASGNSGSGSGKKTGGGPTYQQAMDALHPDVLDAIKATMPGIRPDEYSDGSRDCGGPDWIDSKDASKRSLTSYIRVPGAPSDKRTPAALVDSVVEHLRGKNWAEDPERTGSSNAGDGSVTKYVKKTGGNGSAVVSATPFKLASGETSQTLVAQIVTDCLRNPDYHKN
ncbi:hypothetical protein N4G70_09790 [Streptomyces sp. ASQP_92]|uniref:hypothetical protein n=1 Tax=Streptomyces sp. ASQP_92 TaxID=2979116 RepID=UPI0021BE30E5|nr:hypothetical protein [Streptomyces sp. ASQP_92]MCT9089160.1 hypothetical protein [Streptomyces sp. ASQP_92]